MQVDVDSTLDEVVIPSLLTCEACQTNGATAPISALSSFSIFAPTSRLFSEFLPGQSDSHPNQSDSYPGRSDAYPGQSESSTC